ncbi:MAG: hypothetical protein R2705_06985 [Ilumatobacteraceae bacterium]
MLRTDLDRILKQRNTLLKQAGGRLSDDVAFTLDVWDAKLVEAGEAMGRARARLTEELAPQPQRPTPIWRGARCPSGSPTTRRGVGPGWPRRWRPGDPTTCVVRSA